MATTNKNEPNRPKNGRSREVNTSDKPLAAKALRGEDDNLVNPADESEIGAEIYDYGDGPDASSSNLRSNSNDADSNSTASSDSGAGSNG